MQDDNVKRNRLKIGLGFCVIFLISKLFVIQIIDARYKIDASNNSLVYQNIYPTRGLILDRNGKVLVGNKIAYDIIATPKEIGKFDTLLLAKVLKVSPKFIKDKMREYKRNRQVLGYQSVVMLKQLPAEVYMSFSEIQYKFKGFRGQARRIRSYPINAGGNILGYVSEVDAHFLKKNRGKYKLGDYIGKTGIEYTRENDLKGEKGYHIYLRNSKNRIESKYKNGEMDKAAVPGKNIRTTLDSDLQVYGQKLMTNKVGSLVAIEPKTGEILALVSSPNIDVKKLSDIGRNYGDIMKNPHKPMLNRTVQSPYPPGSVFKVVNALIGLQEGVLDTQKKSSCRGAYFYGRSKKLSCHYHRGPIALEEAIMMSCNTYFCNAMKSVVENKHYANIELAFDKWNEYVRSFGFGSKLGTDVVAELGGNIPLSSYYNKLYGKRAWRFNTVVSLSIGQGEIGVTPLQIANMCAIIANRGYYYTPHIIKESKGIKIDSKYKRKNRVKIDSAFFTPIINGMWKAVNSGHNTGATAVVAAVEGLDICGKTGTAQNPRGDDHSVFICFAPKDNPKIAVAAYVENAGWGASWAAPIASLLTEQYLNGEINAKRKNLEKKIIESNLTGKVKKH